MSKVALLIGVSEYESGLSSLPGAVKDVEEMQRVLQHPDIGGFSEVKTLTNPDLVTMQAEIESLFSDRERDDLIVLFFSGHGITDESGKFYFTNSETRKTPGGRVSLGTTVPASFVHKIMDNSRSKHQVVILDCCFSGAFAHDLSAKSESTVDVQSQLSSEGGAVLASSSPTQLSFEQHNSGLSIYTYYLVEGIDSGAADLDGDGHVSVDELHQYAKKRVNAHAPAMKPQIYPLREGAHIILTSAPVLDTKRIYRREIERLAGQGEISNRGRISRPGREMLRALREALNLPTKEALVVESEVLTPYREYYKKFRLFQRLFQTFARRNNSPKNIRIVLERLQKVLNLRPGDVDLVVSNLSKRRSRLKTALLTLTGAGTIISVAIAGIYTRLYEQPALSFLPEPIHLSLNEIHDGMHNVATSWQPSIIQQLLVPQSNRFRAAWKKTLEAENLMLLVEASIGETAASSRWQEVADKSQEAISLLAEVPPTDPDYQEILTYQQTLKLAKQRAEAEVNFAEAVETARQASQLVQTASFPKDWNKVIDLWQQAINQMHAVTPNSSNYQVAQVKAKQEYPRKQDYAGRMKYRSQKGGR